MIKGDGRGHASACACEDHLGGMGVFDGRGCGVLVMPPIEDPDLNFTFF